MLDIPPVAVPMVPPVATPGLPPVKAGIPPVALVPPCDGCVSGAPPVAKPVAESPPVGLPPTLLVLPPTLASSPTPGGTPIPALEMQASKRNEGIAVEPRSLKQVYIGSIWAEGSRNK
jgi:hypothetical protein